MKPKKLMKLLFVIAAFLALAHLAPAQELMEELFGWRLSIHGVKDGATFSELRFDETDKVNGKGCLTFDVKGESSPSLWLAVIADKLPAPVDLTQQQALAFSYKLVARDLGSANGKPVIGMRLCLSNLTGTNTVFYAAPYLEGDEWQEVVVPVELFKDHPDNVDPWDRTDVARINVEQMLQGIQTMDYTLKIANLHFIPAQETKK